MRPPIGSFLPAGSLLPACLLLDVRPATRTHAVHLECNPQTVKILFAECEDLETNSARAAPADALEERFEPDITG